MKPKYTTVFVIREVSTGKLIKFGSKAGWATSGAAKSAFALHAHTLYRSWMDDGKGLFDSQSDYVLEEIK
jgi:hypothetical protein